VYAAGPATSDGCAPETVACCSRFVRKVVISSIVGGCFVVLVSDACAGSLTRYTVFDEGSYTVSCVKFHPIWASPASDWSSSRPRPSLVIQSRPEAPFISADPALPRSEPEGKRLLVNAIRAVIPCGSEAVSASWTASANGFGGGVGPPPPKAVTEIVPATAASTASAAARRTSLRVESLRKIFMILAL